MSYDRLEIRAPEVRERALMRDLRAILTQARPRAPALRAQLKGVDIADLRTRAALASIPVMRKSALIELQADDPPFGGLAVTRAGQLERLYASPGPIYEPQGVGKDWWGAGRALHAAGIAKGNLVVNCFSYHLTPGGFIMESGARALGCPVIPAGPSNTEAVIAAIAHYRPRAYCGTPDFLKIILDKAAEAGKDVSSLQRALVSGAALPATLRQELRERGIPVRQCYATADLGVVAYETSAGKGRIVDGMMVNEGRIVEIVRPGTGDPVAEGEVGEVVVTRLNRDYPLLRFATGDMSAVLTGKSPCGRTNMRIRGWLGRADQTAKIRGMFVHPGQVAALTRQFPAISRLRLVIGRANEQDTMKLLFEAEQQLDTGAIASALQEATKLRGEVRQAQRGDLPNDGKIIADERPVG